MATTNDSRFGCVEPGCTEHPSTGGGPIFRLSPKGEPFIGACAEHYAKHDAPVEGEAMPDEDELEQAILDNAEPVDSDERGQDPIGRLPTEGRWRPPTSPVYDFPPASTPPPRPVSQSHGRATRRLEPGVDRVVRTAGHRMTAQERTTTMSDDLPVRLRARACPAGHPHDPTSDHGHTDCWLFHRAADEIERLRDAITDENRRLAVDNNHLRDRLSDMDSTADNPSSSTETWPTDEQVEAAAKALFQLAPVFKLDYWRGVARTALEAVAPPPADDRVRAAVMEGERRIADVEGRLEMAEDLLRRAVSFEESLGRLRVADDEAEYLRSLIGEGE